MLWVSYSSLNDFLKCPRFYYWKRIRRLEKKSFNLAFIVGRIMHHGVQTLFETPDKAEKETRKKYKEEAQQARKSFIISPKDEEDLVQQDAITYGMMKAFRYKYSKFLKETKHIATEKSLVYEMNKNVTVVGKIDNVIQNQSRNYAYELKNLKSLDRERIIGIKTDPQTGLYVEINNRIEKKKDQKIDGIIYNIIRKPQIRQKQKESRAQFLKRLEEWYLDSSDIKMHIERLKEPFIKGAAVLNAIDKITKNILSCKTEDDYYQNFSACIREWGRCAMYELCHEGGPTKENLKLYQIRPKYSVDKPKEDDV